MGSGKNFTGVVDLLTNQTLMWKRKSTGDDGRAFEMKAVDLCDDAELLEAVSEARTALLEQVRVRTFTAAMNSKQQNAHVVNSVLNLRLLIWTMSLLNCCSPNLVMISMAFLPSK